MGQIKLVKTGGHTENCVKSRDVPSTPAQSQKVYIHQELSRLRIKKLKKLIIGQLKINSLRNKFDLLTFQIKDNIDILMITETKLNGSFAIAQFFINGFSIPFRLDRDRNRGGVLLYIREDIPSKLLAIENIIEAFFVEINLHKKERLISCSYSPNKALIDNHMAVLSKNIDIYTTKYDNLLFSG